MAGDWRTLKLEILAETQQFSKGMNESEKQVQSFGDKVTDFSKKAGLAFAAAAAAAAAYAGKLAIDGVKAAIEDQQAQLKLASALESATGATNAQIKATEDYISKTSLAVGIADDELRPAFQRLAIATGDVTKSQEILNLAIDISKGTGKDLASVTEALAKAYGGQETQLVRLGIGITAAQAKNMDFRAETQKLTDLYGGAAARNAETFQGKIDRLKVAFNEAKESVGYALLPVIQKLIDYVIQYGSPIVEKFKEGWAIVQDAIERNRDSFEKFGQILKDIVFPIVKTIFGYLIEVGANAAKALIDAFGTIVDVLTPVLNFIINAINKVIDGINLVKGGADIGHIQTIGGSSAAGGGTVAATRATGSAGGGGGGTGGGGAGLGGLGGGGTGGGAGSMQIAGATSAKDLIDRLTSVSNKFTDLNFQVMSGGISQKAAQAQLDKLTAEFRVLEKQGTNLTTQALGTGQVYSPSGTVINLNVSGAIDSEGTARTIIDQLNASYNRGGVVSDTYRLIDR